MIGKKRKAIMTEEIIEIDFQNFTKKKSKKKTLP